MPRTMPKRCPPWWKQTCQEHLAQATCRAKACRAHLQSASPAKRLTLPVRAVMPSYPECAGPALPSMLPRAPRCASQAPYTACAYCEARPPCEMKSDGAEPGFEPGTLRLLAARSNHWAKLALMPWDNMANSWRKLVAIVRLSKRLQVCSPRAVSFFPPGKIRAGWKSSAGDGGLTDRTAVMEVETRQGGSGCLV